MENRALQANTDLALAYTQSKEYRATQAKCQALMDNVEATEKAGKEVFQMHAKYATNFFWQVHIIHLTMSKL